MLPSGTGSSLARYFGQKELAFQAAKSTVDGAIAGRRLSKFGGNRYVNQMGRRVYGLAGLGDDTSPAKTTGWMDVLNTLVGQTAAIVRPPKPGTTVINQAPISPGLPTWAKVAMGVGAAGALYLIIRRR